MQDVFEFFGVKKVENEVDFFKLYKKAVLQSFHYEQVHSKVRHHLKEILSNVVDGECVATVSGFKIHFIQGFPIIKWIFRTKDAELVKGEFIIYVNDLYDVIEDLMNCGYDETIALKKYDYKTVRELPMNKVYVKYLFEDIIPFYVHLIGRKILIKSESGVIKIVKHSDIMIREN